MKSAQTNLSGLKARRKLAGGKAAGRRPRSASRFVTALKEAGDLSQLRKSDIFVENRTQGSKLRRSGIGGGSEYAAPTELNNSLRAVATKMPLLRSYDMAGISHTGVMPVKVGQGGSRQIFVTNVVGASSGNDLSEFCTPSPRPSPQGEGVDVSNAFENSCDRMGGASVLRQEQANLCEFRRNDIFVENQSSQDSKLRRSGIGGGSKYVAPTELNDSLRGLTTKIPLLRSYEMVEGRVAVARASWSAPAERSGDGAFARTRRAGTVESIRPRESGVALRFPPQSKIASEDLAAVGKQSVRWCAEVKTVNASQCQSKQNFDGKIGSVNLRQPLPSLWDSVCSAPIPGVETPGYYRSSQWDGAQPVAVSHSQSQQIFLKNVGAAVSGTPSGCNHLGGVYRGYRAAQPPANFWQPFGLQTKLNQAKVSQFGAN